MTSFTSDASPLLSDSTFTFTPTSFAAFVETLEVSFNIDEIAAAGPSTGDKRTKVLDIQLDVLADHCPDINLGKEALSKLDSTDPKISPLMDRMNLAVSSAYVRGLLLGKPEKEALKESGEVSKEELVTFLDACVAMLDLEETKAILRAEFKKSEFATTNVVEGVVRSDGMSGIRLVHEEIVRMQRNMLECCGIEADFGISQLSLVRTNFADDRDLQEKLDNFISRMAKAGSDVLEYYGEGPGGGVTSVGRVAMQDDGTTRVIHVSHKEVDADDPTTRAFGGNIEMKEREQRKQIEMARQMAVMQQDILAELLSWDDAERKEQLTFCKQVRDEFVQQAMKVPPEQRATFMTTVNPDLQRRLIMLKLWDEMVARNGGVEPEIKKAAGANPPVDEVSEDRGKINR